MYNFPTTQGDDRIYWVLAKCGIFQVKLYYDVFRCSRDVPFTWQSI